MRSGPETRRPHVGPRRQLAVLLATAFAWPMMGCVGLPGSEASVRFESNDQGMEVVETGVRGLGARSEFRSANLLLEQGDPEEALRALRTLADAEPALSAPRVNLAIALREAGRFEEAEAELRRALDSNPRHPVTHNELGIVLRRLGRFEEARASYELALQTLPDFHFALRNRGIVCELFLHDDVCALESYRTYLDVVPEDPEVALWVALLEQRASAEVME